MKSKILLVDDEKGVLSMLKQYFELSGYEVLTASNGNEALEKISAKPDIILLDINMPEMDGLTVCRRIRRHISAPILFLSARVENSDKVIGFGAGAADYIVKPFDLDELGARVVAHLRREGRQKGEAAVRLFGELSIHYQKREVMVDDEGITLTKREFDIIELLSANPGQIFDRERIYTSIWGIDGEGNNETVTEHIRKIRVKLARHSLHEYIETVWGVGYKWNG